MVSLLVAGVGLLLLGFAPARHTGLIFVLTLLITFALTAFDMSTHQPTSTDLAGFTLALMLGGAAVFIRHERGMKD
ncbi:hypothetical protein [Mycobacterium sp. E796]|uniref:hypothetical protein n=1 Tax=Mycobacterium sp. E796 TaxID=1834151 RepID=UPI0007FFD636|nr:hypothetical protein [Mycobacterium sp. E796]OBI61011.1 hypothetical protein A5706_17370 [Mycobacterium sp. E796]